jgi:hypothetical protein
VAGCVLILAAASRITLKVPTRLMRIARSKLASACGPVLPTTRSPGATPAQLIARVDGAEGRSAEVDRGLGLGLVGDVGADETDADRRLLRPAGGVAQVGDDDPAAAATSIFAVAAPRPEPPPATRNAWVAICIFHFRWGLACAARRSADRGLAPSLANAQAVSEAKRWRGEGHRVA